MNVKATSGEEIGFVGRGEGVAALAVAALEPLELTVAAVRDVATLGLAGDEGGPPA